MLHVKHPGAGSECLSPCLMALVFRMILIRSCFFPAICWFWSELFSFHPKASIGPFSLAVFGSSIGPKVLRSPPRRKRSRRSRCCCNEVSEIARARNHGTWLARSPRYPRYAMLQVFVAFVSFSLWSLLPYNLGSRDFLPHASASELFPIKR